MRPAVLRLLAAAMAMVAAVAIDGAGNAAPTDSDRSSVGSGGEGDPMRQPVGRPLEGLVVYVDPGHQLGNATHPHQINQLVDAGGFMKPCNTTGTSTKGGYPEATFAWRVSVRVRRILRHRGAVVRLTRHTNSLDDWGPCVDERGRAGNKGEPGPTADVKVSIHGDGNLGAGAHGFHVIRPGHLMGYTNDIFDESRALARRVRNRLVARGLDVSTYAGRRGIDVRTDLGTINLSDVPTVMAELGNMRNGADARRMKSARGQRRYARALVDGVARFLKWSAQHREAPR